jgi:hypothetical protein
MGLFSWLKRDTGSRESEKWRREWTQAVAAPDAETARRLRDRLTADPPFAPDIEVEEEMLDGLEQLLALSAELDGGRLPRIDTTHRVIGAEACHYSAPVSMPDDSSQPSGRLLLTATRAVFVGGAKVTSAAWHSTAQALQADRDLLLIRVDAQTVHRFRCNTYADALCAAALARYFIGRARQRQPSATSTV